MIEMPLSSEYTSSSEEELELTTQDKVKVFNESGDPVNLEANRKKKKIVPIIRGPRGNINIYTL